MGILDYVLGNPDVKCAVGLTAMPVLGPVSALACKDAVEARLSPPPPAPPAEICAPSLPPSVCEAASYVGRQLEKAARVFSDFKREVLGDVSEIEEFLRYTVNPILFTSPYFPIVVGLERFGYPIVPQVSIEDIGSFALDVAMSSALLGVGAKAMAKAAKGAASAAVAGSKESLSAYKECVQILGGPATLLFDLF